MYNQILNGLFNSENLNTTVSQIQYLESLQEKVRNIRIAYLRFPVRFDYTNKQTQAGYLITYVPHYSDLVYFALRDNRDQININILDEIYFVGSGPCPEVIGLLRYLKDFETQKTLFIKIFDIAIEEWQWSRDIVFQNIVPQYLNGSTINRIEQKIDISKPININDSFSKNKKLIILQNCLNEIELQNQSTLNKNIEEIYNKMSSGSYLLIIDLNFTQIMSLISEIENKIKNKNGKIIKSINDGEINYRTMQDNEPQIILDHLLIDRFGCQNPNYLLPKRRLKFIYTLIEKV